MFRGLGSIIYKESLHIFGDPLTLFFMILIPGLQLTIFGYAIDLDVKNIPTVVYSLDHRRNADDLIDTFRNTGYFDVVKRAYSDEELLNTIVAGEAKAGIKIPPDYTDRLLLGQSTQIQVLIDGSDSTVAMQALNVANAIALRKSLDIASNVLGQGESAPPIQARTRVLFNPDMRTVNFMVPGLVGIIMQVVTMFLTAFAIVREKESGTLEQLMVTPVSRLGLMCGKLIPYGLVGIVETTTVLLIMRFLFAVPIEGSLFLLAAFSFVFLFTSLGLGLLISTLAANQIQGVQYAMMITMPSILLSGFVFPQETMPWPIYWFGQLIPATYFIRILRGIIIRGAGFEELWFEAACLGGMGLLLLFFSAMRFHKRLS